MAESHRQRSRLETSLQRCTRRVQLKMRWLAAFLAVATSLQAQQPAPPVSPEVHPDGRVTFRIRAPKAATVEVGGDWKPGQLTEMTKDADGVWSVTLGPFEPSIYIYWLLVYCGWLGHRRPSQSSCQAARTHLSKSRRGPCQNP
jgi:hypothetical protein